MRWQRPQKQFYQFGKCDRGLLIASWRQTLACIRLSNAWEREHRAALLNSLSRDGVTHERQGEAGYPRVLVCAGVWGCSFSETYYLLSVFMESSGGWRQAIGIVCAMSIGVQSTLDCGKNRPVIIPHMFQYDKDLWWFRKKKMVALLLKLVKELYMGKPFHMQYEMVNENQCWPAIGLTSHVLDKLSRGIWIYSHILNWSRTSSFFWGEKKFGLKWARRLGSGLRLVLST